MRLRRPRGNPKHQCSKCGNELEPERYGKQRYCKTCHAEYMKLTRANPTTLLTLDQVVELYLNNRTESISNVFFKVIHIPNDAVLHRTD